MRVLDLDMDYFMDEIANHVDINEINRLSEVDYGESVWDEDRVRCFLEKNLGLSKEHKIPGRILVGHNEALFFWEELMQEDKLYDPFEVIHVDSHADLGLGCIFSVLLFFNDILTLPMKDRCKVRSLKYKNDKIGISIADYLLWAIAYGYLSKIVYGTNPHNYAPDVWDLLLKNKRYDKESNSTLSGNIQLKHCTQKYDTSYEADKIIKYSTKDPEVEFIVTNKIENVKYNGDFDFVSIAQSPNYTPASADFILDIFRDYINEI